MSTSKKIDLICIVAVIAALILTILFANGEALGIKKIQSETASEANDYFTVNDLYSRVNETDATEISLQGDSTSIKGNGAYYNAGKVSIVYAGTYLISGELSNGQIEIDCDGDDKVYLIFDNVTIYCEDSAALIVENADKVFLNLKEGSVNSLASGSSYSSKAENAGINVTLFARDDLTINGTGSLKVNASYYHGIVAKDKLKLVDATLDVEAKQDAIHVNDKANIKAANLTLSAGDDGITVKNDDKEGSFYMESGSINIKESYEGIEAVDITIMDGHIDVVSSDDGFNACTTYPNSGIKIYGGNINIINSGGDADGLDSNGSIFIYGGNIFISVPSDSSSTAIDYGSEVSGICKIDGGRVIACGSSSMLEGVDSSSAQCTLIHGVTESIQGGQTLTIKASDAQIS